MIKMAVFDMDGTLLNKDNEISIQNLASLKYLRDNNVLVIIATGRPEQLLKPYFHILGKDNYYIMYNGSVVKNIKQNDYIVKAVITKDEVKEILSISSENNVLNLSYAEVGIYSKPNYRVDFFKKTQAHLPADQRTNFILDVDNESIAKDNDIYKVLLIENDPVKYELLKDMYTHIKGISQVRSHTGYLDLVPKNSSKGNAVKALGNKFNITSDEIVVFGDQDNDISMFEFAKYSVAMGNAIDRVKEKATFVTFSNSKNGVAYAVDNYVKSLM
ncbi:MAG: HAD family hydrolase [Candidatus Izemoplasma sp.]